MTTSWQWEDPRRVLARHGLVAKRAFSQNFLVAKNVVERIVGAIDPREGQTVVELGAGLGTLTGALLGSGARVVAVDLDRDMLEVLRAELGGNERLEIIAADAAHVDLAGIAARAGDRVAVAGNLPYASTGAILRHLVNARASISRAVVMVQREVRDRLVAVPGTRAWGALAVFTQNAFDVRPVCVVPAGAFHPPPRVQSAVVALLPRAQPLVPESAAFGTLVRATFESRRKTLRNSLLRALDEPRIVDDALATAKLDARCRGETLTIAQLGELAAAWEQATARAALGA